MDFKTVLESKCTGGVDSKNGLFSKDVFFTWIFKQIDFNTFCQNFSYSQQKYLIMKINFINLDSIAAKSSSCISLIWILSGIKFACYNKGTKSA